MTYRVRTTPAFREDVADQATRIKKDAPTRAEVWIRELYRSLASLEELPFRFPVRFELGDPAVEVRAYGFHSHLILYTVDEERREVAILRAWHHARRNPNESDLVE